MPKVEWIIGDEPLPKFSKRSSKREKQTGIKLRIKPLVKIPEETINVPDEIVVLSEDKNWLDIILSYIGLK